MPLDNGSFVCFFISARQLVVQISALLVFLTTASVLSKPASSSCFLHPLPLPFNLFHLKPFFPIGEHNGHESSISGGMPGPPHSCVKKCAMCMLYSVWKCVFSVCKQLCEVCVLSAEICRRMYVFFVLCVYCSWKCVFKALRVKAGYWH